MCFVHKDHVEVLWITASQRGDAPELDGGRRIRSLVVGPDDTEGESFQVLDDLFEKLFPVRCEQDARTHRMRRHDDERGDDTLSGSSWSYENNATTT